MNTLLEKIYNSYSSYIYKNNKTELFLLEPLSSIIRLAMLSFCEEGTKIAILNNKIYVQEPTYLQPILRKFYGVGRTELSHLLRPIVICKKKYNSKENKDIENIFNYAVKGLKKLKIAYNNEINMTCHCLQLYINYIENDADGDSKEFNEISHIKIDEFTEKLYEEFSGLWSNKKIELISNLLDEAEKCKEERSNLITAINSIVDVKENQSITLIEKYTKNLKK